MIKAQICRYRRQSKCLALSLQLQGVLPLVLSPQKFRSACFLHVCIKNEWNLQRFLVAAPVFIFLSCLPRLSAFLKFHQDFWMPVDLRIFGVLCNSLMLIYERNKKACCCRQIKDNWTVCWVSASPEVLAGSSTQAEAPSPEGTSRLRRVPGGADVFQRKARPSGELTY